MATRVYHVQSTGQLVVLHPEVVQRVLDDLEAKIDAIDGDVDNLRRWLREQKEEKCSRRPTTGDSLPL